MEVAQESNLVELFVVQTHQPGEVVPYSGLEGPLLLCLTVVEPVTLETHRLLLVIGCLSGKPRVFRMWRRKRVTDVMVSTCGAFVRLIDVVYLSLYLEFRSSSGHSHHMGCVFLCHMQKTSGFPDKQPSSSNSRVTESSTARRSKRADHRIRHK